MVNGKKNNYFVIGQERWDYAAIKYRRHRIAERLASLPETNQVYWIAPYQTTWKKALNFHRNIIIRKLDNGIIQLELPEYKGMIGQAGILPIRKLMQRFFAAETNNCVWYTYPAFWKIADPARDKIVYDCSDLWGSSNWSADEGASPWKKNAYLKLIRLAEQRIAQRSEHLFATSETLGAHLSALAGKPVEVIENGVGLEGYSGPGRSVEEAAAVPEPRLVFSGGIKKKIDLKLVRETAECFSSASIVMIGPISDERAKDLEELRALKNVYFLGEKPSEAIPDYLHYMDVGLMPYKDIDYNKAVSPLKLFEYLAAGLGTVGHGVPTTERHQERGIYSHAQSYEAFFEQVGAMLEQSKNPELIEQRKQLAAQNGWTEKIDRLVATVHNH
ncbi:glycosyltransferase [Marinococcus halophilus]|uniref:glycosyltransferase n=1 Tax=Marinococcus halophilus TaxID=1371 RepID=UPI0009A5B13D|nr:glycosyltransferase [Marinococcus halophilus]